MARTRIAAAKAAAVAGPEVRLLSRDTGALGVGDATVGRECGGLAAARQLGGGVRIDGPRMKQVEVARCLLRRGEVLRLGQTGGRILCGEARDVVGRAHGLLDGVGREVGTARIAATLADEQRHAE
jgi:hypothetical protein